MDVYKSKNWSVNVGASITFEKNKVVKLPEQNRDGIIDGTKKIVEGMDRYQFYTYTWEGVNTKNGLSLYKFNDDEYFFTDGGTTYGNPAGTEITGSQKNAVVVIDGTPYSYLTTYGKREFHGSAIGSQKNAVVVIDGTPYSYLTTYGKWQARVPRFGHAYRLW